MEYLNAAVGAVDSVVYVVAEVDTGLARHSGTNISQHHTFCHLEGSDPLSLAGAIAFVSRSANSTTERLWRPAVLLCRFPPIRKRVYLESSDQSFAEVGSVRRTAGAVALVTARCFAMRHLSRPCERASLLSCAVLRLSLFIYLYWLDANM